MCLKSYFFISLKIKQENIKIIKTMTKDYSKGKIYTIRNKGDEADIYVGSTIQEYLCQRFAVHRQACRDGKSNCLLHQKMRETDVDDWYIELYEAFPCKNKDELLKREGEVIRLISSLNKNIAGRTCKQYYDDNKGNVINRMKRYYKDNRHTRLAYQNAYNRRKLHNANVSVTDADTGLDDAGDMS